MKDKETKETLELFSKTIDVIRELEKLTSERFDLQAHIDNIGRQAPSWLDDFSYAQILLFCVGGWYFDLTNTIIGNNPFNSYPVPNERVLEQVPDWVKWWYEAENEYEFRVMQS